MKQWLSAGWKIEQESSNNISLSKCFSSPDIKEAVKIKLVGAFDHEVFICNLCFIDDEAKNKITRYSGSFTISPEETDFGRCCTLTGNPLKSSSILQITNRENHGGEKVTLDFLTKLQIKEIGRFDPVSGWLKVGERSLYAAKKLLHSEHGTFSTHLRFDHNEFSGSALAFGETRVYRRDPVTQQNLLTVTTGLFVSAPNQIVTKQRQKFLCDSTFSETSRRMIEDAIGVFKEDKYVSGRRYSQVTENEVIKHIYWYGQVDPKTGQPDDPDGLYMVRTQGTEGRIEVMRRVQISDDSVLSYKLFYNVLIDPRTQCINEIGYLPNRKGSKTWALKRSVDGYWVPFIWNYNTNAWIENPNPICLETRDIANLIESKLIEVGWVKSHQNKVPRCSDDLLPTTPDALLSDLGREERMARYVQNVNDLTKRMCAQHHRMYSRSVNFMWKRLIFTSESCIKYQEQMYTAYVNYYLPELRRIRLEYIDATRSLRKSDSADQGVGPSMIDDQLDEVDFQDLAIGKHTGLGFFSASASVKVPSNPPTPILGRWADLDD